MDQLKLASDIEKVTNAAFTEFTGLSDDAVRRHPTTKGWSVKEIIGHLIDSASNNHQRWVRLQISDRLRFPDYAHDNERWVRVQRYEEQSWESLLGLWRLFNLHLSAMVRDVHKECLQNAWVVDEGTSFTLDELMVDYLRHLNAHIEQIRDDLNSMKRS